MLVGLGEVKTLFDELKAATGLCLNFEKCQIIPLGANHDDICLTIEYCGDGWQQIKVTDYVKLLGVLVGPGADGQDWVDLISKVKQRIREIRQLALGIPRSIVLFNAVAFSLISYHVSFRAPPKHACGWFSNVSAVDSCSNFRVPE